MRISDPMKIAGLLALLFFSCTELKEAQTTATADESFYEPWESLGELFHDVQMAGVYPDSKTFVDSKPKRDPAQIAEAYRELRDDPDFDLSAFVKANFDEPVNARGFETELPFGEHLQKHWTFLTRDAGGEGLTSTLIPLPNRYIVPGGRFREVYYWDSYFSMIGLGVSGRSDLIGSMLDNFAYLIDSIGFIPNGNRTYYLGRSQPPYFSSMVNLYMQLTTPEEGLKYLPAIQREYDFWMSGAEQLSPGEPVNRRVVRLSDGSVLNRYWDDLNFPRPESHREDYELGKGLDSLGKASLYKHLRAGAESGWDYSTRWFADKNDFASIQTTDFLPVDLNSLLYAMESHLSVLYGLADSSDLADTYAEKAEKRKAAIQSVFWNEEAGGFTDYNWRSGELADQVTLAGNYPLYFKIATQEQAAKQALLIKNKFLLPGGLVTTTIESGQQWDYPNGWAPLQWISIKGLEHYNENDLAEDITNRWLRTNQKVFQNTGKMMEKYNVADTTLLAGGGEYPTQDGFGWSNGVALGLMAEDPKY